MNIPSMSSLSVSLSCTHSPAFLASTSLQGEIKRNDDASPTAKSNSVPTSPFPSSPFDDFDVINDTSSEEATGNSDDLENDLDLSPVELTRSRTSELASRTQKAVNLSSILTRKRSDSLGKIPKDNSPLLKKDPNPSEDDVKLSDEEKEKLAFARSHASLLRQGLSNTRSGYHKEKDARILLTAQQQMQLASSEIHHCCVISPRPEIEDIDAYVPGLQAEHQAIEENLSQLIASSYRDKKVIQRAWFTELKNQGSRQNYPYSIRNLWAFFLNQTNGATDTANVLALKSRWEKDFANQIGKAKDVKEFAVMEKDFWAHPENAPYQSRMDQCKSDFIDQCIESTTKELKDILSEYKKHVVARFIRLMKIHAFFARSYATIMEKLSTHEQRREFTEQVLQQLDIAKNGVERNADDNDQVDDNADNNPAYGNTYYRVVQGGHQRKSPEARACKEGFEVITQKLKDIFNADFIKKLPLQKAHTVPAPGLFSWHLDGRIYGRTKADGTQEKRIDFDNRMRISKTIFYSLANEIFKTFEMEVEKVIEKNKNEQEIMMVRMMDLLTIIPLAAASETEHLPGFFNSTLDHYSEARLVHPDFPKGYKEILAHGLKQLMICADAGEEIDFASAVREHKIYLDLTQELVQQELTSIENRAVQSTTSYVKSHGLHSTNAAIIYCRAQEDAGKPRALQGADLITLNAGKRISTPSYDKLYRRLSPSPAPQQLPQPLQVPQVQEQVQIYMV